jgi:hypothetical protein
MGVTIRRLVLFGLLMTVLPACNARTFKVLDSATDLPLPGVEAHFVFRGILPGIGHPMEITLREWHRKSDQNGEFSISPPFADRAFMRALWKEGYGHTDTVKEYRLRQSPRADPEIYFLTPTANQTMEYIRYLAYLTTEAVEQNKGLAGLPPIINVAMQYGQAKGKAKTDREIEVLREFCKFSSAMKAQADAGWPDMGNQPETRKAAQELLDDCKTR